MESKIRGREGRQEIFATKVRDQGALIWGGASEWREGRIQEGFRRSD